ncbi:MAG: AAA family ATPase [Candidatus Anstonellales archaeon]
MKIILITGKRGAGKSELAKLLSSRIPVYEMSDYVYREMRKAGIDRFDAITVGEFAKRLRTERGNDIVAKLLWEDIKGLDIVVISGARSPEEVEFFRKNADVLVIKVDALPEIRYHRILQRARPGDVKSFDDFIKKERLDEELGVGTILEDIIIDNNYDLGVFRLKVENLLKFILDRS